jgi:hypothetical protein
VTSTRRRWKLAAAFAAAALALAPGWRATLAPVDHEEVLEAASRSRTQTGVTRPGDAPGEQWHLQYLDSWTVRMLDELGLRGRAPSVAPPTFAAHLPAGSQRADAYYRVVTEGHWPWWRPGRGVDWSGAVR